MFPENTREDKERKYNFIDVKMIGIIELYICTVVLNSTKCTTIIILKSESSILHLSSQLNI